MGEERGRGNKKLVNDERDRSEPGAIIGGPRPNSGVPGKGEGRDFRRSLMGRREVSSRLQRGSEP